MAVIKQLEKYKTYYVERVKGKDGITRPITKVRYIKPCIQCGGDMFVLSHKNGGVHKRSLTRWWCQDRICGHRELEQSHLEHVRIEIHKIEDNLAFGNCPHKRNMTSCPDCNPYL